jgi:class I fructose-bisphosphate aldolase
MSADHPHDRIIEAPARRSNARRRRSTVSDVRYRLNRLFNAESGRCLDVAIDHGFFGERHFLNGIEDLGSAIDALVEAAPDAIQLTQGQAPKLQAHRGKERPALVMRTDVANVYGAPLPDHMFSLMIPEPAKRGVQLDAAIIVVNLLDLPGRPEVREACVQNVLEAKADCEKYGMPLMVEPLVMKPVDPDGSTGYTVNGDLDLILPIVRQAVELGADVERLPPGGPHRRGHSRARARRWPGSRSRAPRAH